MSQLYYNLIKEGLRTIDQVPERNRADVQALLDANQAQTVVSNVR